jgi:hypothetical protein
MTEQATKLATLVKKLDDWRGDARLYKLSEPVEYEVYNEDDDEGVIEKTDFLVVSAAVAIDNGDLETFIFPADDDGRAMSMMHLPGSIVGVLNHQLALLQLGYVAPDDDAVMN